MLSTQKTGIADVYTWYLFVMSIIESVASDMLQSVAEPTVQLSPLVGKDPLINQGRLTMLASTSSDPHWHFTVPTPFTTLDTLSSFWTKDVSLRRARCALLILSSLSIVAWGNCILTTVCSSP